ncbi:hypothetical protein RvY_12639 [Ramazzottius varieornatus]|uniref:39S ribosomal protein L27, mitochondrial n=1 Tax=Ramazzottius varieornatus TaxID=947166 RepID=A0A1D1VK64_RAMVA|nr:hypothetical protein RvY_12639 [Ramazzottius varieornatus]
MIQQMAITLSSLPALLRPLSRNYLALLSCPSLQPVVPSACIHLTVSLQKYGPDGGPGGRRMGFRAWQRGFWVKEGERVTPGTILVRQVTVTCHPGEHVGMGRDRTLFALEHGRLFVTTEAINPNWKHRYVREAYTGREGHTIFKTFVHIHPDPQPQKFKLVSLI